MVEAWLASAVGGVLFGLALAAPPGPMNAIIAEESVVRGWDAGVRAGLGALVADVCFFLLALAGAVAVVQQSTVIRAVMLGVGGGLMLSFAYGAVRNARRFGPAESSPGKGFRKAFVLALTNPYQIGFWLTVGIGLLTPGRVDVLAHVPGVGESLSGLVLVRTGAPPLIGGLFFGIVVWILGFPAALVAARERVASLGRIVAWLSALVLAGFGTAFVLEAATAL